MKLPILGDKLIRRFNPMDDKIHLELTTEMTEEYDKLLFSAKSKKLENQENEDVADYEKKKLTIKERLILFTDSIWFRYLTALLYPLLISFFVKKQQIQEPDDDDFDDDENDYPDDKTDLKRIIKMLKNKL